MSVDIICAYWQLTLNRLSMESHRTVGVESESWLSLQHRRDGLIICLLSNKLAQACNTVVVSDSNLVLEDRLS